MALMDAGIPMKSILLSIDVAVLENNEIIIDPTLAQLNQNDKGIFPSSAG
jgi:ribonuclease PH